MFDKIKNLCRKKPDHTHVCFTFTNCVFDLTKDNMPHGKKLQGVAIIDLERYQRLLIDCEAYEKAEEIQQSIDENKINLFLLDQGV